MGDFDLNWIPAWLHHFCGHGDRRNYAAPRSTLRFLAISACFLLTSCQRDSELELREKLNQWFYLGGTVYFESQIRCTGAVFHLLDDRPRPSLVVQDDTARAKEAFRSSGIVAIQMAGVTPAELTDDMLPSGSGILGKEALSAGALAVSCFEDTDIGAMLHESLTSPGAILAYESETKGLMILHPFHRRLIFLAGDVW